MEMICAVPLVHCLREPLQVVSFPSRAQDRRADSGTGRGVATNTSAVEKEREGDGEIKLRSDEQYLYSN